MHCTSLFLVDLALVAIATLVANLVQSGFMFSGDRWLSFAPYLAATVTAAAVLLPLGKLHRSVWRFSGLSDYLRATAVSVAIVATAVSISFVLDRLGGVPRALPLVHLALLVSVMVGVRVAVRLRHKLRKSLRDQSLMAAIEPYGEPVLLVGWGNVADLYIQSTIELSKGAIRIVGMLAPLPEQSGTQKGIRILGGPDSVGAVLDQLTSRGVHVSRIVVASRLDTLGARALSALLGIEAGTDIKLDILPDCMAQAGLKTRSLSTVATQDASTDRDLFIMKATHRDRLLRRPYWRVKRCLDALMAVALLIFLAPAIILVAIIVAIDVGRPVLFWQQRPGHFGRPFRVYKFRTMAAAHDSNGRRLQDDERMSFVGLFLRRTRLDELPQLVNILCGEMSFVGPRPLLPTDQPDEYSARLWVRPGLTGWAQLRGGRIVSARDKAALDVWYVQNASFWLDLKILAGTVPMLVFGERVDEDAVKQAWLELEAARFQALGTGSRITFESAKPVGVVSKESEQRA